MRSKLSRIESYESGRRRIYFIFNPSPSEVYGFVSRYGEMSERWLKTNREKEVRGVIAYETGDYNFYIFDPLTEIHAAFAGQMDLDRYLPVYVSNSFITVAIGAEPEALPGFRYKWTGGVVINKEEIIEYLHDIPAVENAFKNGEFKVLFEGDYQ